MLDIQKIESRIKVIVKSQGWQEAYFFIRHLMSEVSAADRELLAPIADYIASRI